MSASPRHDIRSLPELEAVWRELFGRPRPEKIVCVGLNYRAHSAEQNVEPPERPLLFAKWPNALITEGESIVLPRISDQVDFEAELGVVIGEGGRVWGYTCLNDVSARDLQFSDKQWTRGKSLDTFCPVGPALVPAAEVPDPQALRIRALLNGETMQDATTADMMFGVDEVDPERISVRFLRLIWDSRQIRAQIEQTARTTAGIYKINQQDLRNVEICLPLLSDQEQLVAQAEDERLRVDLLRAAAWAALARAASLRRSILATAFRGGLVPQDPHDEPASVLLERIAAERAAAPKPTRKRREKASA